MTIDARTYHTWSPKGAEVKNDWLVVDVDGRVLGRVATQIASLLRGKHKPTFATHMNGGDHVIVLNVEKLTVTGRKADQKVYYRHTGYPGGLKTTTYKVMKQKHPDRILRFAVKGMLPKTRLGRQMMRKLHLFTGSRHPHAAQQPTLYALSK